MIIRSETKSNFTCIPNQIFTDDRLSRKAKCLLLELLSKPDNWNLNYKHLVNSGKEGEHAIRAGINELINAGYIHKEIPRQKGKISKTEHFIYDRPMTPGEHRDCVGDARGPVTPPEEYPNHQADLFQVNQDDEKDTHLMRTPARKEDAPTNTPIEKNHMVKIHVGETAPIINTDSKQILRGTTATAPAREVEQIPEAEVKPKQQPQSYPATSEINNLLDLIPERFASPMTDALIQRSLSTHTPNQIADAVIYSIDNVKGGKMQFKAYLDKCLCGGWSDGYQAAREVPDITPVVSSFGAMGTGRYPNGTVTGSEDMDTNILVGIDFMKEMGVTI